MANKTAPQKKKIDSHAAMTKTLPKEISPAHYLPVVWEHLTEALCEEVFLVTRDRERQRKWTLFALFQVWIGLLHNPMTTQTNAIFACGGENPFFPSVQATPESFFMRIQSLRPRFFRNVFLRFTQEIESKFPKNFATDLPIPKEIFPEIYVIDGSRLEQVGRLLKIARKTTRAIIPGSMEGVYDLRRGHLRNLWFDPDGARSEMAMFEKVLVEIPEGALLAADRYYPKPVIWQKLAQKKIWMVSRYNKTVGKQRIKILSRIRNPKVAVDDWIVTMGGSQKESEAVTLRWVHVRRAEGKITLITNVLDPKKLSVAQLVSLYKERWSIERMYLHLKEVLSLNRLFNASPAAVGQQVYATAILYNALRLSQAKIAQKLKIPPERFSPDKLFPQLIEKLVQLTWMAMGSEVSNEKSKRRLSPAEIQNLNRALCNHPSLRLRLEGLFVEKRKGVKKKRRFCAGRSTWTTYNKILGGKKYLRN